VFRGDACDPYETAAATLGPQAPIGNSVQTLRCDGVMNAAYEGGRVPIDLKVRALAATAVQVEVVKCACVVSGDHATCTNAAGGDCPQEGPPQRPRADEDTRLFWSDVERTGGCVRRADSSCGPLVADVPASLPLSWDWQAELAREAALPAAQRHLDPAWFEDAISDIEQVDVPYRRAVYPFAFATSVSAPTGTPGAFDVSRHYPPPTRGMGQEAAVSPRWNALATSGDDPDAFRRTARMRTVVAPELRVPVTPHPVSVSTPPTTFCNLSFPTDWPGRDRWTLPTLREIDPYWISPDPFGGIGGLRDLARTGPTWTLPKGPDGYLSDLRLWRSAREPADAISVDGLDPAEYLLGTFDGAPVRAALGDDIALLPDVIPAALASRQGWEAGPAMLLSSRSSFVVLARAPGTAEGRTRYNTVLRGNLPNALVGGSLAITAHGIVGYRESRNAGRHLYALLPGQRNLTEALFVAPAQRSAAIGGAGPANVALMEVPIDQTDLRDDATFAFLRGHIVRAGGTDAASQVRGDVVRFDARTGDRSSLPGTSAQPFPARRSPALVWDADDRGLALGGGVDASGVAHDDVYLLREGDLTARKIVPDSPIATRVPLGPESPLLVLGAERRAVRFGASTDFSRETGTTDGWQGEDVARCGDGSMPFRCGGSGAFWVEPGASCPGEACVPSPLRTLAGAKNVPGVLVVDAGLSTGTVWAVRANSLERYDALVAGKLTLKSTTRLPALGTVVLPPGGPAGAGLVGTLRGIALYQVGPGGVQIEATHELCGRPIDIAPLGADRFAIATTVGLAIATRTAMGLTIEASGLLDERGFTSVPRTPVGKVACLLAEVRAGVRGDLVVPKAGTSIAWSGSAILVLRKSEIVQVTASATPAVVARSAVAGASHALRVEGGTAYVAEESGGKRYDTTTLLPLGAHDVSEWVRRKEAGELRLRQRFPVGLGTVEIAWIRP